jgi:hypothetical protein
MSLFWPFKKSGKRKKRESHKFEQREELELRSLQLDVHLTPQALSLLLLSDRTEFIHVVKIRNDLFPL